MSNSIVRHRRALHRIPEVGHKLPKTAAYVRAALEPLGCEIFAPIPNSVCAFFDAGREETVAFRADMDALAITERTGLPYASCHPGFMHACGHDGHTAMALGLAEYAAANAAGLTRNVLVLFQPAEESPGGAKPLCETGVLEKHRVSRIFGLHLWPGLPAGRVFSRPGPLMARANEVTVTITGRSVHIARYPEGVDALAAGAEYLRRAYAAIDALPSGEMRAMRFGRAVSGAVRNAVSDKTVLEGSLRTYQEELFHRCRQELAAVGEAVAAETGCSVEIQYSEGYPPVWNHECLYETVCALLGGDAPVLLDTPTLTGEDFSHYQRRVPGVFFFLGVGDTPELHAPDFAFDDEAVLPVGVEFLKKLLALK